jgi:hypothetical protein
VFAINAQQAGKIYCNNEKVGSHQAWPGREINSKKKMPSSLNPLIKEIVVD